MPAGRPVFGDREAELLRLVGDGYTTPEIAVALGLNRRTVKYHLQRLCREHGVTKKRELVPIARRLELEASRG